MRALTGAQQAEARRILTAIKWERRVQVPDPLSRRPDRASRSHAPIRTASTSKRGVWASECPHPVTSVGRSAAAAVTSQMARQCALGTDGAIRELDFHHDDLYRPGAVNRLVSSLRASLRSAARIIRELTRRGGVSASWYV